MSDWVDKLKNDVDKVAAERAGNNLNKLEVEHEISYQTNQIYEYILRRVKDDMWQIGSQLLSNQGRFEVNYPENIVNLGAFRLDLSNYRYTVKFNYKESRIEVNMTRYDHPRNRNPRVTGEPRWNMVENGKYDFFITTDTQRNFIETDGVRQLLENVDEIIQKLFGNLYKAFKLEE